MLTVMSAEIVQQRIGDMHREAASYRQRTERSRRTDRRGRRTARFARVFSRRPAPIA